MKRTINLFWVMVFFLNSCVTYSFIPTDTQNMKVKRERGTITPIYSDEILGISIVPKIVESYLALQIIVRNNSDRELYMADTFFTCYTSKDKKDWKIVNRYSSEDFYKIQSDAYTAGVVLMAISAGLNSATAGRGSSHTRGNVYGDSPGGSFSGSYNSSTTYYDPTAAELSRQRNQANVEAYSSQGK